MRSRLGRSKKPEDICRALKINFILFNTERKIQLVNNKLKLIKFANKYKIWGECFVYRRNENQHYFIQMGTVEVGEKMKGLPNLQQILNYGGEPVMLLGYFSAGGIW